MLYTDLISAAKQHFPDLQIKYKDQSTFMKILGKLLFFNPSFMKTYTTTIGSTIYFPSKTFLKLQPAMMTIILLHELIHVNDAQKLPKYVFEFLYLFPQIISLLLIPLLLVSWKLFLPLIILFALPLPAYFRMIYEKRAYLVSLYVTNKLNQKYQLTNTLEENKNLYLSQFKSGAYYFMWIFPSLDQKFNDGLKKILNNERPFDDNVFDIIDSLIEKV